MGYNVVEVYEEKVSGFKKNEQRPIFSKMLDDINTNQIDKVLVWELSRIGRSRSSIHCKIFKHFTI